MPDTQSRDNGHVLAEILWDLVVAVLGPVFGADDFRREGPPGSSHWLRRRNRWNVVLRQVQAGRPAPGVLPARWRRSVLEVVPGREQLRFRRRWHYRWHSVPATSFRRSEVRLPERRELSKFRQVFPIKLEGVGCEIAVWTREIGDLKRALDAAVAAGAI